MLAYCYFRLHPHAAVSGGGKSVIINKAKTILYYVERELQRMAGNGNYESILDSSVSSAVQPFLLPAANHNTGP